MEKRPVDTGPSSAGPIRPVGPRARPAPRGTAHQAQHAGAPDVDAAAERLDALLREDAAAGGSPRADVPPRGYYLNILV